jgi:hypothetical protein
VVEFRRLGGVGVSNNRFAEAPVQVAGSAPDQLSQEHGFKAHTFSPAGMPPGHCVLQGLCFGRKTWAGRRAKNVA